MRVRAMIIPCLVLAGLVACTPDLPKSGKALYRANCVSCHGQTGIGDGPMADDLPVVPADLTLIADRNGGAFPTGDVMATIYGYRGKDYAGLMPAFGPVLESAPVLWTDPQGQEIETPSALLELAQYLGTLQQ